MISGLRTNKVIAKASGCRGIKLKVTEDFRAVYERLRRVPIGISESLLNNTLHRLRAILPEGITFACPLFLTEFELSVIDGKTMRGVKRRLRPLRGVKGGLIGDRAVVSLVLRYGIAEAMKSDERILITNLHDGDRYHAVDLPESYRRRRHIERVFQEVTEVFGLEHWTGSGPEATISTEKYIQDVRDDLIACTKLIGPGERFGRCVSAHRVVQTAKRWARTE